MKGSREEKVFVARRRRFLRAIHWDSLNIFKFARCKKWRKQNRRPRDGSYGTAANAKD